MKALRILIQQLETAPKICPQQALNDMTLALQTLTNECEEFVLIPRNIASQTVEIEHLLSIPSSSASFRCKKKQWKVGVSHQMLH